jgi:2-polyprenyl-3-methyl-5-hydroxy-6-metoxy-1,4-benzoquinol methylase
MTDAYFDTARAEIAPHLPSRIDRLLDIGCGAGATTRWLKERRAIAYAAGVEYLPAVAARAEGVFDQLWVGDIAHQPLEQAIAPGSLDLVLCLDVLEHLADPWSEVKRLSALLAPGGRLIVSVPNIRHYRFIWRLVTRGDFRYREFGLLDRTHLRFFVRDTAEELATCGGLRLVSSSSVQRFGASDPRAWLNALAFGRLTPFLAKQWLVVAER